MKAVSKLGWTAYALAAFVIVADQLSKHWVLFVYDLPSRLSVPIAGPFSLTMVWNRGVSFGLFRAEADLVRWLLAGFSVIVAVMLAVWARKADRPLMALGLGFVIGGALGNVIDRIRFGAVADFLDFQRLGFFPWVFNVADSAITVGVVFLLLDSMRKESAS
ncbi:MAG: signal peptidase II [Pseudomonadota bacterium]|uniref:signal peptidase II n=1 Tax=unclassified Phenylobacterium TaxID=2640670 RepID=UPI00070191A6|nr:MULTISPECIES: signal peptidase II [unclassified Phenylobacterium]KRB50548.1 signal peptidase II [Phenylobacterium sp. Root700]MBT9473328.1 signal peptidase II [Phenylobacterium sp.]